jgi:predicted TIM-barrel fold metal-dependent hydrolase
MTTESTAEYFGTGWRRTESAGVRIVDTHCHSFPPLGRSRGWDPDVHGRLTQYHMRDFRDVYRKSDGARLDEAILDYPSDDIYEMPDVGFRLTEFGKVEFSRDGVDYYMQAYPPALSNWDAPGERMVSEMDIAGVDVAVLQSDHVYGDLNEYYGELTRRFPGRFAPLAQVREWEADTDEELERGRRALTEYGCKGIYFSVEPLSFRRYEDHLQDAKFRRLWDLARELDVPIWWYLDARKRDRKTAFMERLEELTVWCDANPDIPNLMTHGLVPAIIFHDLGIPDVLVSLLKRPNVYAEFQNPAKWPEYPYPEGQEFVKRMCGEAGAETFTWGSDMPFAAGFWCTYKQAVDHIGVHCDFLNDEERAMVLGGNAARILKL